MQLLQQLGHDLSCCWGFGCPCRHHTHHTLAATSLQAHVATCGEALVLQRARVNINPGAHAAMYLSQQALLLPLVGCLLLHALVRVLPPCFTLSANACR